MNRPAAPTLSGFWPVTLRLAAQELSTPSTWLFTLGIPLLMYLLLGTGHDYSDIWVGHGDVSAQILLSMATYTVVLTVSTLCAGITIERIHGWTRTMTLTPLGIRGYILAISAKAMIVTIIPLVALYTVGFVTGAEMERIVWIVSFALLFVVAPIPALLGFLVGMVIPGEQAYGVLGGGSALLAFLSGIFVSLDQLGTVFQTIAQYTPLWGIHQLVLAPIIGWQSITWQVWVNVGTWFAILIMFIAVLARRIGRR